MPNNLATLRAQLDTQLRDVNHSVWGQTEKEQMIIHAVARLSPRVMRHIMENIPAVASTYEYALDPDIRSVFRVDVLDAHSNFSIMPNGSWEVWGDAEGSDARTLHIGRAFVRDGITFRVHGYGNYNVTTNLIDDSMVPLVLARARAEAYRRMGADRVQFENWLTANQTQNVSVNELLQLINEANREVEMLDRQIYTIKKPVPARV